MTQDEIIEITRQAGGFSPTPEFLEAFAKLVEDAAFVRWAAQTKLAVQEEREACAMICENYADYDKEIRNDYHAHLIRARGEA